MKAVAATIIFLSSIIFYGGLTVAVLAWVFLLPSVGFLYLLGFMN